MTPIHRTARNGHTEIVRILVPLTANPNAPNHIETTPLMDAANTDIQGILEYFVRMNRPRYGLITVPNYYKYL